MLKNTYTVKEVAKLLDFSTNTVYKYLDEGSIKAVRMGEEGRFRIPASEVERLLHEKGMVVSQVEENHESHLETVSPIEAILEEKVYHTPSLFDWFVATMSICLGFALIAFKNTSLAAQSAVNFTPITIPMQILLLIGGIMLVVLDISGQKHGWTRKILKVILSLDYIIMGLIFFTVGKNQLSAGYLAMGVVIFLTSIVRISQQTRYLLLVNLINLLIGIGLLLRPTSFLLPKDILMSQNITILLVAGVLAIMIWGILFSFLAIKKNKKYIWFIVIPTVVISMSYAVISFTAGLWARSIFCIVIASYSLMFPFADKFESFTLKSKKDLILSFVWIVGTVLVGSLTLFFVHHSFQEYALTELGKRVDTASDVVTNYMDGDIAKISTFAEDYELIDSLKNIPENKTVANYNLRQLYKAANRTIARVVLVNTSGVIIDTYPFISASQGVDISDREYFIAVKNGARTYVSGIAKPSTPGVSPAVLISMPVNDQDGNLLGVLIGSVDLAELERRVNEVRFSESGKYLLVDAKGNYIIAPTSDRILTKAPEGDLILEALNGKSGSVQSLGEDEKMSLSAYKKIDKYGWGIMAQQPYSEVFNPYSQTVFIIFFVLIASGVGSLLIVFSLKKDGK